MNTVGPSGPQRGSWRFMSMLRMRALAFRTSPFAKVSRGRRRLIRQGIYHVEDRIALPDKMYSSGSETSREAHNVLSGDVEASAA